MTIAPTAWADAQDAVRAAAFELLAAMPGGTLTLSPSRLVAHGRGLDVAAARELAAAIECLAAAALRVAALTV